MLQRSQGRLKVSFKQRGGATVLDELHQSGCAKVRLPNIYDGGGPEAVLLNTAGGLTGGDEFSADVIWQAGTCATVTSQAAERIYRASGGHAWVSNRLTVAANATAYWLPQETILFEGGAVQRDAEIDLADNAQFFGIESWMIGRHAMGEVVRSAMVRDQLSIRRHGKLIFTDRLHLAGDIEAHLQRPAIAGGQRCFALLVAVVQAPELALERLRQLMPCSLVNGVVVARLLAASAGNLRDRLAAAINQLNAIESHHQLRVPRVWSC